MQQDSHISALIKTPATRVIALLVKIIMLGVVLCYIAIELFNTQGLRSQFRELWQVVSVWHPIYLVLVFMMPVNWVLESFKWQRLLRPVLNLGLGDAVKGVLTGVALGFVTPHSLGDYIGRIAQLEEQNRLETVGAVLLGRGAQFLATLSFGLFGLGMWYLHDEHGIAVWIFPITLLIMILLAGAFFSAREPFVKLCRRIWPPSSRYLQVLNYYPPRAIVTIIGLSVLRYLVFALQFTVLLYWFEVPLAVFTLWCGVTWVFLAKSVLPAFNFLSDLGVREFSALYFFGLFSVPVAPVLAASLAVWTLNILFPAFVGAFLINQMKIFRS